MRDRMRDRIRDDMRNGRRDVGGDRMKKGMSWDQVGWD